MIYKLLFTLLILASFNSDAKGTYQAPDEFIAQAFSEKVPDPSFVWVKGELKQHIEHILQHKNQYRRIRFWQQGQRSVWVLKEIGKEKPITVGIVIDSNKITQLKVLIFKESRGWEVRYPFFTKQFNQLSLIKDNQLSDRIDSISGATLSVRALRKLARIALLLNINIQQPALEK